MQFNWFQTAYLIFVITSIGYVGSLIGAAFTFLLPIFYVFAYTRIAVRTEMGLKVFSFLPDGKSRDVSSFMIESLCTATFTMFLVNAYLL